MRLLYHLWLSPACRKIRVVLQEKGLDFTMKVEKVWERRPEFLARHPRRQGEYRLSPRLYRLSRRAAALARRRPFLARGHRCGRASLGARLSRRRAVGGARAGQGMVCARQVAAELPPDPRRPHPRLAAARALRGPRLLGLLVRRIEAVGIDLRRRRPPPVRPPP